MILLADRITDPASGQQTLGGWTSRCGGMPSAARSTPSSPISTSLAWRAARCAGLHPGALGRGGRRRRRVLARVTGGRADGRIVAVRQGFVLATSFHPG